MIVESRSEQERPQPRTVVGLVFDFPHVQTIVNHYRENRKPEDARQLILFGPSRSLSLAIKAIGLEVSSEELDLGMIKIIRQDKSDLFCFILNRREDRVDKQAVYPAKTPLVNAIVDIVKKRTGPGESVLILGDWKLYADGMDDWVSLSRITAERLNEQKRISILEN